MTDRRTLLILAAGQAQLRAIQDLLDAGFRVVTADQDPAAPGHHLSNARAVVSIQDAAAITEVARDHGASLILPVTEAGVLAAATASSRLNLPGIDVDIALSCLDKGRMRLAWQKAGLRQPSFILAHDEKGVHEALATIGLPAVIKPRRAWSSKGVTVLTDPGQVAEAIQAAAAHSGTHGYIVEQFVDGPLLTSDGFVKNGTVSFSMLGDVEFQEHKTYRVNMSLNYPARYTGGIMDEARSLIAGAVHALGLRNGAFHCECLVGQDGVHLVELAARPGGGHLFGHVIKLASGLTAPVVLAELMLGADVDVEPRLSSGACYRFMSAPAGTFIQAYGEEVARHLPGVDDLGLSIRPGQAGGAVSHDNARHGWVVTGGANRNEAVARACAALAAVRFEMTAS